MWLSFYLKVRAEVSKRLVKGTIHWNTEKGWIMGAAMAVKHFVKMNKDTTETKNI